MEIYQVSKAPTYYARFFVQKFREKLFCTWILGYNFFGARILAQMRS
jgi:hypothetical protein